MFQVRPVRSVPQVEHLHNALVNCVQVLFGVKSGSGNCLFSLFVCKRLPGSLDRVKSWSGVDTFLLWSVFVVKYVLHHRHLHLLNKILLHLHQQRLQRLFEVFFQSKF